MPHTVTLIPGDGIGPEISECAKRMIAASGAKIVWEEVEAGAALADATGNPIPENVLDSIRKNRVALKGPIGTPIGAVADAGEKPPGNVSAGKPVLFESTPLRSACSSPIGTTSRFWCG